MIMIVDATADKHKLYEFGRRIVRGGQGKHRHHKKIPKKRHLRVNKREARRRLLDYSLVLSREDHFYTIQPRELLSFSYSYSHEASLHKNFLLTMEDGTSI
jgi:hypothetical protein